MDELMDMMVDDASASQISDKLKDILFAKSAERVDAYRPNAANSLLKLIEEPSENNYFILINNGRKKLIETIKSRAIETKIFLIRKNITTQ